MMPKRFKQRAKQPARVRHTLPRQTQIGFQGRREPRADIVLTVRRRWRIHGNDKRFEPSRVYPIDQRGDVFSLAMQVRLKPRIGRALDAVTNRVYPVYHDAANRTQRGAAQDDAASQDRWGVVRVEALGVQTTSSATAETLAGVALADRADPAPRVQIAVRQVRAISKR